MLCVFDDTGYRDRRKMLGASRSDFKDIDLGDKRSAVKNDDTVAWRLYEHDSYGGSDICIPAGGRRSDPHDQGFNDEAGSASRRSTPYRT